MHVYYYDEKFKYQGEDVIDFDELPENATDVSPEGLYLPEYDAEKREWFESASKEYIESLQPKPQLSKIEIMEKEIAELYYLLAVGGESS
ncbi:hypothetical protein HRF57_11910 [Bacillus safensis]|uniref:hypothetical protein n=1 Tax=Bacillus safensis TaxID=561879 RepID=UPI00156197E5|nr:hypothetical protein [Bacillus safensis]NRF05554.1 hypothetical protein [Bacillus safensis]